MKQPLDFQRALPALQKSKFRSKFKLDGEDVVYITRAGRKKIELHAADFIQRRLAPALPHRDGKQTPFKGHPVFKAQHATATCCRGCLCKWYAIPKGRVLTHEECQKIVRVLLDWIDWNLKGTARDTNPAAKPRTKTVTQVCCG